MMSQREKFLKKKEKVYGQFFTPAEIADFIVSFGLLHLDKAEKAIDPACGDGVFLSSMLKHGLKEVWGVDIDSNVHSRIPRDVAENRNVRIIIGDALTRGPTLSQTFLLPENYFDMAVGNPPFSAKFGRVSDNRVVYYEIAKNRRSEAIEVLFLERFLSLVRPGGVVGIIIPDSILVNKNYEYVRRFILNKSRIIAIISLPRRIFRSDTTSKTSILFLKKGEEGYDNEIFIYTIEDANNISRELLNVLDIYRKKGGLWVKPTLASLHPKSYIKPEIRLGRDLPIYALVELIREMRTGGTEYAAKRKFVKNGLKYISAKVVMPYGLDFKRDEKYIKPGSPMDKKFAYVKPGDVLFVRVGVGCAGRSAVVVDETDVGVADDWIYIIRVNEEKILPHYLAVYIQTEYGKVQLESMKRGVGTVTIPQSELKKLLVPIPPKNFQEDVKRAYIKMVELARSGERKNAMKMFEEIRRRIVEYLTLGFSQAALPSA